MTISNTEMNNRVSRHLENLAHIKISPDNEWFIKCVEFFMLDNPNIDVKGLSSLVTEQLSLSDFNEIKLSSLPPNLSSCEKRILSGKYCLQVNTILDVGHSCYSQYNLILKRDTSNTEIGDSKPAPWEPKSHRMLKLMCTDGQQNVMAMEYEPLTCLKEPFIPGFKISIIGPVEYRKGVLLLKSNNVHFLGGEVEDFLIKNAPLNVLCRALNKEELENPYMFSNIEIENTDTKLLNSPKQLENNINRTQTTMPQSNINCSNQNNFVGNGVITYDDFFDGDDDELLYLTQVAEIETQIAQSANEVKSTLLQTNDHQNNTNFNKPTSLVSKNNTLGTNKQPIHSVKQTKISDMLGPSTSSAFNSAIVKLPLPKHEHDQHVNNYGLADKQASGKRSASSPVQAEIKKPSIEFHNPEDIWDDIDMDDFDSSNSLIKVLKSTSVVKNTKIQVKQNEWICSGIIMDESNQKEVEFSSEVLERLIGVSSKEVIQFKNNPLNCAPLKEKIEKGIKGAYRKLHLFKGEMTLTYSSDRNKKPIVTNIKM